MQQPYQHQILHQQHRSHHEHYHVESDEHEMNELHAGSDEHEIDELHVESDEHETVMDELHVGSDEHEMDELHVGSDEHEIDELRYVNEKGHLIINYHAHMHFLHSMLATFTPNLCLPTKQCNKLMHYRTCMQSAVITGRQCKCCSVSLGIFF